MEVTGVESADEGLQTVVFRLSNAVSVEEFEKFKKSLGESSLTYTKLTLSDSGDLVTVNHSPHAIEQFPNLAREVSMRLDSAIENLRNEYRRIAASKEGYLKKVREFYDFSDGDE